VSDQTTTPAPATDAPAADSAEPAEPRFIDLALSRDGEPTGETKRVQVRMPTETQMLWFEATFHRFKLAMEAWQSGAQFSQDERGELYNDILDAVNVFVMQLHDRKWISTAMARGTLDFGAIMTGIDEAARVLDLDLGAPAQSADVVVE
jgi:hypothetical protein